MCIDRGLNAKGCLPGPLKVKRRANELYEKLLNSPLKVADDPLQVIDWINAYAFAVSEENAAAAELLLLQRTEQPASFPPSLTIIASSSRRQIKKVFARSF